MSAQITYGTKVTFDQGDDDHTELTGVVTRVWPTGTTVTVKAPGKIAGCTRTFVRDITAVRPA